uniref:LRRCT domain-containing protein n=1 Tax=Branchiostoma floridae TaxID=7739 RepID=C3ZUT3_BRAFL|eukprot:XP_002587667.1 hypothetical protein BRAFLDRAFT_92706 [Branchiostoma floridae]
MKVSGLLLFLLFLCLGCSCLPEKCLIRQQAFRRTSWIDCNCLSLTTIPDEIPSNAYRLFLAYNNIRNVTNLPPLPKLNWLDLAWNGMESFSWMSLRALPDLTYLYLNKNLLRYVQLDSVIEHLPQLKFVDVSYNQLVSVSQYDLGWPQVKEFEIAGNPFRCDCDLFWLIDKMACLQACTGKDEESCCLSCPAACFLAMRQRRTVCHSPSGLNRVPLSDVSTLLTGCGAHQLTTKAAMVLVDKLENQMQRNGTSFRHNNEINQSQSESTNEKSYQNDESIMINPTRTINKPSANTMKKKKQDDDEVPVLYISIIVIGSLMIFIFIFCIVGIKMKSKLCHRHRQEANIEGLDHGHPVALDNEEQFIEPIYGTHAQASAATASRLYNMCDLHNY